jgi:two-component system, NtrC family, response regulator HydG
MIPAMRYEDRGQCVDSGKESPRKKILLVDAEEHHRTILGSMLEEDGYQVASCGTLFDAVVIFQTENFDFVICEHSTSGVDGLHLLKIIKHHNDKIPVLLISTLYETEPYLVAMNLGALDYLSKPVDYLEIQRLVRIH